MKSFRRSIISGLLFTILGVGVAGQIPNSLYFMPGVPQSNRINPSIQPGWGFYIGMPGVAPLRFQVSSSSLGFNDVITYNQEIDSLVTPFHPLADKDAFLKNLKETNYMLSSLGTSLASFGFRSGKSFFSFDITTRVDGNISYPRGIFDVMFDGAPDGSTISLSGIGVDVNVFNEFSMGYSRKDFLLPGLDVGIRGKLLFGIANVATRNSVFDISTSMEAWNVNSSMQMSVAAPQSVVTFNSDIENEDPFTIDSTFIDNASPGEIVRTFLNPDQAGLALDIGASYRILPQLLVSASVMDIGGIRWKNTMEGNFDFQYEFRGIEVNPFTGVDTTFVSELTDSLINSISFVTGTPYFSKLNTKLFVGVSYYPIEKIGLGLLSRTDFLGENISQQFTGSVNMTTGKFINLSLSYSYMSNTFNNIGAGLSFNVGPLNLYLISDNIVSGALNPLNTRSVNLWFGMNLAFGWQRAGKKAGPVDRPLIL